MIKLAGLVTEKKELGGAYIDQLYDLTDKNNHTRARAELARHVGDKRLIKAYEGLMYVEDILRDANDTSKARARLDKILFSRVKKQFDDWNQILGAF
jgi:GTP cyclohydrolase FolE2